MTPTSSPSATTSVSGSPSKLPRHRPPARPTPPVQGKSGTIIVLSMSSLHIVVLAAARAHA
jgi:hypothetical protein